MRRLSHVYEIHASSTVLPTLITVTNSTAAQTQMQEPGGKSGNYFGLIEHESKHYTTVSCKPLRSMYESLNVLTLKPMSN